MGSILCAGDNDCDKDDDSTQKKKLQMKLQEMTCHLFQIDGMAYLCSFGPMLTGTAAFVQFTVYHYTLLFVIIA